MDSHLPELGLRHDSLSEQVHAAIREAIINKTLMPGSTVTEAQLAKDLGVSKTPVREALLRLREVGLVQPLATRGVRVIEPTREAIVRAYEVRWVLDSATAQLAALRATREHCAQLDEQARQSLEAAKRYDAAGFSQWDRQFHGTVWRAASNPGLEWHADNAYALASALRAMDAPMGGDSINCAQQHVGIAEAIREGQEQKAYDLAGRHVQDVLRCVLPADPQPADPQPQPGSPTQSRRAEVAP